jgi:hypothetical protein
VSSLRVPLDEVASEPVRTHSEAHGDQELSWCPSGTVTDPESVVLGVRSGASGELSYLAAPIPAADVISLIPDDIEPRRVLRFASHCVSSCANRAGDDCTLVDRLTKLPAESELASIPRCHLRPHCKWWNQVGVEACRRCPAVVTTIRADDEVRAMVADPSTTPAQFEAWLADTGRAGLED